MRRLDDVLLAGVGVLTVHQLAYTASAALGYESSIAHGHLAAAWLLGSLAALVGLASAVTRSLRRRSHDVGGLHSLSRCIVTGYAAMEALERTVDGVGAHSLLGEPVFWLGLAAAPAVAFVLRSAVGSAERIAEYIIAAVAPARSWPAIADPGLGATTVELVPLSTGSFTVSRRGPPVRLHT